MSKCAIAKTFLNVPSQVPLDLPLMNQNVNICYHKGLYICPYLSRMSKCAITKAFTSVHIESECPNVPLQKPLHLSILNQNVKMCHYKSLYICPYWIRMSRCAITKAFTSVHIESECQNVPLQKPLHLSILNQNVHVFSHKGFYICP